MKLLVILICLLSERYLIHNASYHRFSWFPNYSQRILQWIQMNNYFSNPWLVLASIILPLIIVATVIYFILSGILFGFIGLLLSILIFFYCLGPQNIFYPPAQEDSNSNNTSQIGNYFAQANNQLFAVIFWYVIAGPIMILAFRLVSLSRGIPSISEQAIQTTDILEWLPARLTALLYLLVGNFQRGLSLLTHYFIAKPDLNYKMLSECGLQAIRTTDIEEVPMPVAESFVEHAVIVLLVLIALFTLVAWL